MTDLRSVALGEAAADLVVADGEVFSADRGTFERRDVLVAGDRIAAVTSDSSNAIDGDTRIVDADGHHVVPGFIDAHTHADSPQTVETAYHRSLLDGTTSIVTETSDLCSVAGPAGLRAHLAATEGLPLTVFATVPPQWFYRLFEPSMATESERRRFLELLSHDRVVGVGELDWIFVTGRESAAERLIERARQEGNVVCGHGSGCRNGRYAAFASVIDNDHEAITPLEVRERLDNDVHVIGRCGTGRDDIRAVATVVSEDRTTNASLSTDGLDVRDLLSRGHMAAVVGRAIETGIEPADAIRMATVVPARNFRLDDRGAIAPGNVADIVVLEDLDRVSVSTVLADGDVVVADGELTVGTRPHEYPKTMRGGVDVTVSEETFAVSADAVGDGPVRAIGYTNGFFTAAETVVPVREDGRLNADPDADLLKAALLCRHPRRDAGFTGFLTGFGLRSGAIATTITREVPGIAVVGANDRAMCRAVRRVDELGGGYVLAETDRVVTEIPLPIGGAATDEPIADTAADFDAIERALRERGVEHENPLLGVETLSFPGVPELKLSFSGYADVVERETVGLPVDE